MCNNKLFGVLLGVGLTLESLDFGLSRMAVGSVSSAGNAIQESPAILQTYVTSVMWAEMGALEGAHQCLEPRARTLCMMFNWNVHRVI